MSFSRKNCSHFFFTSRRIRVVSLFFLQLQLLGAERELLREESHSFDPYFTGRWSEQRWQGEGEQLQMLSEAECVGTTRINHLSDEEDNSSPSVQLDGELLFRNAIGELTAGEAALSFNSPRCSAQKLSFKKNVLIRLSGSATTVGAEVVLIDLAEKEAFFPESVSALSPQGTLSASSLSYRYDSGVFDASQPFLASSDRMALLFSKKTRGWLPRRHWRMVDPQAVITTAAASSSLVSLRSRELSLSETLPLCHWYGEVEATFPAFVLRADHLFGYAIPRQKAEAILTLFATGKNSDRRVLLAGRGVNQERWQLLVSGALTCEAAPFALYSEEVEPLTGADRTLLAEDRQRLHLASRERNFYVASQRFSSSSKPTLTETTNETTSSVQQEKETLAEGDFEQLAALRFTGNVVLLTQDGERLFLLEADQIEWQLAEKQLICRGTAGRTAVLRDGFHNLTIRSQLFTVLLSEGVASSPGRVQVTPWNDDDRRRVAQAAMTLPTYFAPHE